MGSWFQQAGYGVRFEWGATAAATLSAGSSCMIIVDVLSFTTSVAIAAERGTLVYPYRWRDETAATFAAQQQATLAADHRSATPEAPWTLSPAALRRAPFTPRLVLPSPNGSAIAAACASQLVLAGCLRNAAAAARWVAAQGLGTPDRPVTVIAAGERWADHSMRPALEDLLGAGAIISALHHHAGTALSPEAVTARACFHATADVAAAVRNSGSGVELTERGFADDVAIATELDASTAVPVRAGEAFGPAAAASVGH